MNKTCFRSFSFQHTLFSECTMFYKMFHNMYETDTEYFVKFLLKIFPVLNSAPQHEDTRDWKYISTHS
jgi:hypothetical protein